MYVASSPFNTRIAIRGGTFLRFTQSLCSNDVQSLPVGQACEAFFPTAQGKILGHVYISKHADQLELLGFGEQHAALLTHLQKYSMIEDVEVIDLSDRQSAKLLWWEDEDAASADALLGQQIPELLSHKASKLKEVDVACFRPNLFRSPVLELRFDRDQEDSIQRILNAHQVESASTDDVDRLRIANHFPWHGIDISDQHLAQEANRNEAAISFTKGCYLGQETVARIDALGHVNKKLVALEIDTDSVPTELPFSLTVGDKQIGVVTSVTNFAGKVIGLGMIRREHNTPGNRIESNLGTIEVRARHAE